MADLSDIQSVIYSDCPYTKFPSAVDTITRKTDMDATTRLLVDRYNTYVSSANFTAANELLRSNPDLRQVVVVAEDYNRIRDGLIAVERVFNGYVAEYIAQVVKSKGTWDSTVKYKKYDVVVYTYDNAEQTYICLPRDETLTEVPAGIPPTDQRYWACITASGKQGVSGTGLSVRGGYDPSTIYYKNDLVYHNGFLYAATTSEAEDQNQVLETSTLVFKDSSSGYVEVPIGSKVDPNGSYYIYNDETGNYDPVSDNSTIGLIYSSPYEIRGEEPSSSAEHWDLLQLNYVDDVLADGVTVAASGWSNGVYTISNEQVTADTLVDVLFNPSSFDACTMSGIYVNSVAGAIELHCLNDAPTVDIVVDHFRLRNNRTV